MLTFIWKQVQNEILQRALWRFIAKHDVDTDCIEDEVDIFNDEKDSNLHGVLRRHKNVMNALQTFVRHHKIMNKTFATGIPLFYWKWYRTATEQDVKGNNYVSSFMNLGGHSVEELSVNAHFDNLKNEILATGLTGPKKFEKMVVQKAAQYMETNKCRKMRCKPFFDEEDPLHFDIPSGTPLTAQHLQTIILYCDFTELCTLFSRSLRKNDEEDGLQEIKKRNSKFFHFTKKLRELVTYFGSDGYDHKRCGNRMNGMVEGPFFCGVNVVLNLSEFSIGFNTPTSTTKTKEIAVRFAGERGMVITVGNQKGWSKRQPVFNATWISAFCEEDEYLWFGSVHRLSVEAISIVALARTHRQSIGALYLFAAALSGQKMGYGLTVEKEEKQILDFCFKNVSGDISAAAPKGVDGYIMDSVYCFRQRTTKMKLALDSIYRMGPYFKNLIFYGMTESEDIPSRRTNIFRSSIFNLFPNLVEVELVVGHCYRLNLLSLLSVLNELVIPSSFKVIKFRDWSVEKWLNDHFKSIPNVKEQFAAKNWVIEQERMWIDDDIFIKKQQ